MDQFPTTTTTLAELPNTLKFFRKTRNLKLREVAKITELSLSFISDVERGRTLPSLDTLARLCRAYNAPIMLAIGAA